MERFDIIGDLHGQYDKACALLGQLGYQRCGETYHHPEGRKVLFLGDYIDRGPKIRETLHLVKSMVDAGCALAIMGNHEYNAVAYDTPDGKGSHLRPRTETNRKQHEATLTQFEGRESEWREWLTWFKNLPMHLDMGSFRAVHACWSHQHLPMLPQGRLQDDEFLRKTGDPYSAERHALDTVLKGPEMNLPNEGTYLDRESRPRRALRVRWWNLEAGMTLGAIAMPEPHPIDDVLLDADVAALPNYYPEEVPVFFGHYWLEAKTPKVPLASNVVCLDFSGALAPNPLVAYRWEGVGPVTASNFVVQA